MTAVEEPAVLIAADVYLMAFACEPHRGSEPGVGFAAASAIAALPTRPGDRRVLVTRPHKVEVIQDALAASGAPPIEVLAVPLPALIVGITGRRRVRLAYVLWQWLAVRAVRRRLTVGRPAVVHHVTFASEGLPTFEGRLRKRAALVFGPAGSSTDASGDGTVSRRVRRRIGRPTLLRSDVLVAQSNAVAASWRAQGVDAAVVVEPNIVIEPGTRRPQRWDVVTVGRLIPRKRVDLALRAFALGAPPDARLGILGDGPLEADLRRLAAELDIASRVEFVGFVEREESLAAMASARVLLHPSRQEGAPWVIGEAQSVGTHPIALRGTGADEAVLAGGLGTVVDDPTPEALAAALAAALAGPAALPSDRWSAARLPDRFTEWYGLALERSAARLAR